MAIYTKKEFADKAGIEDNAVRVYLQRGKLVAVEGKIDDTHPMNELFLKKREGKEKRHRSGQKSLRARNEAPRAISPEARELLRIELEKKRAELKKAEQELELNAIKIGRHNGASIPIETVKMLYAQHFKNVYNAFLTAFQNILIKIAKKTNMSATDVAAIRAELTDVYNQAVREAVDKSKRDLRSLVTQHAEKREQGEKK